MTIASEITRLQNDKEAMRQAIIGKGVSVAASVSLDNYASCINAIEQGGGCIVEALVVGGGGAGGCGDGNNHRIGGGGGGGVVRNYIEIVGGTASVTVGTGGASISASGTASCVVSGTGSIVATGGGGGCVSNTDGGASGCGIKNGTVIVQSFLGGTGYCTSSCYPAYGGGGGGGTGGAGCCGACGCGGNGGKGMYGYGGGGGGGSDSVMPRGMGCGIDGGGCGGNRCNSAYRHCDATDYGGGGGGSSYGFGKGCQGVVDICYPSDGSFGFTCATGGTKTLVCNTICRHRFTSNGTFTIVS